MKPHLLLPRPKDISFVLLLPLFFVWHGFVEHYSLVPLPDMLFLLFYYLLLCCLLSVVCYLIIRSWRKAALFTFLLLSLHFFFGAFHDTVKSFSADGFLAKYSVLLTLLLGTAVTGFVYLKRSKRPFMRLCRYLTLLLLLLILVDTFQFISKLAGWNRKSLESTSFSHTKCLSCKKPDVYWIVADEYAGSTALREVFNWNNSSFEKSLEALGFKVVANTLSNYNFTPFSIASTLNLSYLNLQNTNHVSGDVSQVMSQIGNNELTRFFAAQGYSIFNNSIFDLPGEPKKVISTFLPDKTTYITAQTLYSRLERDLYYHLIITFKLSAFIEKSLYNNLRSNELLYRHTIETSRLTAGPKFSYTHLSMPHPPYYFNEHGQPNPPQLISAEHDKQVYVDYLRYSNGKLLSLVQQILQNSRRPPVIFLTSDHGFRLGNEKYDFMNLCAVYAPSASKPKYYDGMSAVNIFRTFINDEFKQQLPLLPDSTIYLKD
ncbi:MAG: sulfatase-like hydrolase/transferase [Chitinophagaceae bacterium]